MTICNCCDLIKNESHKRVLYKGEMKNYDIDYSST